MSPDSCNTVLVLQSATDFQDIRSCGSGLRRLRFVWDHKFEPGHLLIGKSFPIVIPNLLVFRPRVYSRGDRSGRERPDANTRSRANASRLAGSLPWLFANPPVTAMAPHPHRPALPPNKSSELDPCIRFLLITRVQPIDAVLVTRASVPSYPCCRLRQHPKVWFVSQPQYWGPSLTRTKPRAHGWPLSL